MSKRAFKIVLGAVVLWAAATLSERSTLETSAASVAALTLATHGPSATSSTTQQ